MDYSYFSLFRLESSHYYQIEISESSEWTLLFGALYDNYSKTTLKLISDDKEKDLIVFSTEINDFGVPEDAIDKKEMLLYLESENNGKAYIVFGGNGKGGIEIMDVTKRTALVDGALNEAILAQLKAMSSSDGDKLVALDVVMSNKTVDLDNFNVCEFSENVESKIMLFLNQIRNWTKELYSYIKYLENKIDSENGNLNMLSAYLLKKIIISFPNLVDTIISYALVSKFPLTFIKVLIVIYHLKVKYILQKHY